MIEQQEFKFTIAYMKGCSILTHKETKKFETMKLATEHFRKLLVEYEVNRINDIPTYHYCRMEKVE